MTTTSTAGVVAPTEAASAVTTETPGEYVGEAESPESLLARIAERVVIPRPDCIIWTGATDRGYGRIHTGGTAARVHRVVWQAKYGPIPDDLTIDHLCRVRACCNTDHMELVTGAENTSRAHKWRPKIRNGRPLSTHCPHGHEFSEENTYYQPAGGRSCRSCRREQDGARRAARRRAA